MPAALATVLNRLRGSGVARHLLGDDVVGIPILLHPHVSQPPQHERDRRGQIGREHRLPHRKHANGGAGLLLENGFECGGPPQTRRSSRRQQDDDADLVGVLIEVGAERGNRFLLHRCEWGLPRRGVPCREQIPAECQGNRGEQSKSERGCASACA